MGTSPRTGPPFPAGPGRAGVPTAGDTTRITHANATNYNVTLNANASISGFLIGSTGGGTSTLTQNGSAFRCRTERLLMNRYKSFLEH